jgi:hypothetical protein
MVRIQEECTDQGKEEIDAKSEVRPMVRRFQDK